MLIVPPRTTPDVRFHVEPMFNVPAFAASVVVPVAVPPRFSVPPETASVPSVVVPLNFREPPETVTFVRFAVPVTVVAPFS